MAKKKNEIDVYKDAPRLDRIRASYLDDKVKLTPKELQLKNIYRKAWTLMLNMYSPVQAAKVLQQDDGIPESTAFRHVKDATTLYGVIHDVDSRGLKIQTREAYWSLYQMCLKKGDIDGARKNLDSHKAMLESEVDQLFDKDKLEATKYEIVMPEDLENLMRKHLDSGVVDMNSIDGIDDISFKEISEEEEDED